MIRTFHANQARLRRHQRLRRRVRGTEVRPRLNVFRSATHIYAQIIDDTTGRTLVAASSLDELLRDFKPEPVQEHVAEQEPAGGRQEVEVLVESAAEAAPTSKKAGRAARSQPQAQQAKGAKGGQQQQRGRPMTQVKTVLPSAQKGARKTPVEALAAIAHNRKVAVAREVGKLVARRAREQGIDKVVFDRGGYAYHGRVAALAEGAREGGLQF
jgi:ribosomal protein L18